MLFRSPEIGQQATAEEMEGKDLIIGHDSAASSSQAKQIEFYPQSSFDKNFPLWKKKIELGTNTPERIIAMVEAKGPLTKEMKQQLLEVKAGE